MYQQTDRQTYRQTNRPTNKLLELLEAAKNLPCRPETLGHRAHCCYCKTNTQFYKGWVKFWVWYLLRFLKSLGFSICLSHLLHPLEVSDLMVILLLFLLPSPFPPPSLLLLLLLFQAEEKHIVTSEILLFIPVLLSMSIPQQVFSHSMQKFLQKLPHRIRNFTL